MILIWLVVLAAFLVLVLVVDRLLAARAAGQAAVLVKKAAAEAAPAVLAEMVAAAARVPAPAGRTSSPSHRHPSLHPSWPLPRPASRSSTGGSGSGHQPSPRLPSSDRPTSHPPISASPEDRVTAWAETTKSCAPSSSSGSRIVSATGWMGRANRKPTDGEGDAADV